MLFGSRSPSITYVDVLGSCDETKDGWQVLLDKVKAMMLKFSKAPWNEAWVQTYPIDPRCLPPAIYALAYGPDAETHPPALESVPELGCAAPALRHRRQHAIALANPGPALGTTGHTAPVQPAVDPVAMQTALAAFQLIWPNIAHMMGAPTARADAPPAGFRLLAHPPPASSRAHSPPAPSHGAFDSPASSPRADSFVESHSFDSVAESQQSALSSVPDAGTAFPDVVPGMYTQAGYGAEALVHINCKPIYMSSRDSRAHFLWGFYLNKMRFDQRRC